MSIAPYAEPTHVEAIDGDVVLQGPDSIGLSMTPEAAIETGKRLRKAGAEALRQRSEDAQKP